MPDAVEFITPISERDWDASVGGWRCSALALPGSQAAVFVNGAKLDDTRVSTTHALRIIRWTGTASDRPTLNPDNSVAVLITLTKKLTSITVPIVVAIIGALATVVSTVITAVAAQSAVDHKPVASDLPAVRSNVTATEITQTDQFGPGQRSSAITQTNSAGPGAIELGSWQSRFNAARGNELSLARLGEEAFKAGEYEWTVKYFNQAELVRSSGVSDWSQPYRVAALFKLNRDVEAKQAITKLIHRAQQYTSRSHASMTLSDITAVRSTLDGQDRKLLDAAADRIEKIAANLPE